MDEPDGAEGRVPGTVLVVDDNQEAVDIVSRLLATQHFHTTSATSGRECLRIARSRPIDVIVLDVMMPEMDGLAVCAELAKDERTRAIPVILLTARDDHETRAAGMMLGVSEFLTKPVNKLELRSRVEAQLRSRALARRMDAALKNLPER